MLKQRSNGHFVIGLLSLLLTVGLLFNFITGEYGDEKAAMVLETRDDLFVEIFSNIEDNLKSDIPGVETSLSESWNQLDSLINHTTISDIMQSATLITDDDKFQKDAAEYSNNPSGFNSMIIEISDGDKRVSQNMDLSRFKKMQAAGNKEDIADQISAIDVVKRIIPQILFSILVLLSILATYFMFLRQLKKERKLSQIRNDFMSNMSHELKTPVSTISVALEALSNFNASNNRELSKEYIEISKHEVNRLGLLVDKALNISLYEQGKFIADTQILDLNAEIKSVIKILKVQLESTQVNLNYQNNGNHFNVEADKTHIVNVIHNLIENAIKYSNKEPRIDIVLTELEHNIQLTFTDNGTGISLENQEKIFDKFYRVTQGNRHNTKGHGLGLSYVKEVINKHNGTINVKSQEDVGSTFTIVLPKIQYAND